jgi:integrase/recombinase XerD
MLSQSAERYIELRHSLGYKLRDLKRELRAFARFSELRGDSHVRTITATDWANKAPSPYSRSRRMRHVILFARFIKAEDGAHEIPSFEPFRHKYVRPTPYIYSREEISRILGATRRLKCAKGIRRIMYETLFGLIAATGLRVSEALDLRIGDVGRDGVLSIRDTKFGKSRYVPLHPSALTALNRYLEVRVRVPTTDDHVFSSAHGRRLSSSIVNHAFRRVLQHAGIKPVRGRLPRIHDLRHTFATRSLENCSTNRNDVAKHYVANSTYLGHVEISSGYWYLTITPQLMTDMAQAAERLAEGSAV